MKDLELHRLRVHRLLLALLWLQAPIDAAVAYWLSGPWVMIGSGAVGCALVATALWRAGAQQVAIRATIAVAYVGEISLLLGAASGSAWQVDIHMYYFACVAMIAVYCDPIAILAATVAVAVHHLVLNFALPYAVYPGGSDLPRVLLHAGILLLEAGGLIWTSVMLVGAFQRQDAEREAAVAARAEAQNATERLATTQESERQAQTGRQAFQESVAAQQGAMVDMLAGKLERIANGDLTARIAEDVDGQFAKIKADFNGAVDRLETAILAVAERADGVRDGTAQITKASEDLAHRTEQQAASLEETAASLDDITSNVKRATESAFHARDVVSDTNEDAKSSAVIVRDAVEAMGAITGSSSRIGQIIGVIDEIAFQTNLLALNAGVEAARAGDSGRGFAVVAAEVRLLAQRSADAAKQIKDLISASIAQVGNGAKLVNETGSVLERIAAKVSKINEVIAEIAESTDAQSTRLREVNGAVVQMDRMTQQNAAMAEEATAASRSLTGESEQLAGLVRQFRTKRTAPANGLRAELAAVAPHAFKPQAPRPAPRNAPKIVHPPRRDAGGALKAGGDWSEF
jgi:methyl-accepting chemotaxis protein